MSKKTAPDAELTGKTAPAGKTGKIPRVPWNPVLGALFVIVLFFVAQLIGSLVVLIYPGLRHWSNARADDWLNNATTAQFWLVLIAYGLSFGGVYLFLRAFKTGWRIIGLRRPRLMDPVYGLLGWLVYFIVYLAAVAVVSHFVPGLNVDQKQQIGFNNVYGFTEMAMTFVSLVVLPPLVEETLVRGFLYSSLKKGLPTAAAVIITSLLFAAAHLDEGGAAGPLYIGAIDTFLLSLTAIYLREKTGRLWAGITLHAFKNGVAFVALFVLATR